MLEDIGTSLIDTIFREWIRRIHQQISNESKDWEKSTENLKLMDKLIENLERGESSDKEQEELYNTINEYRFQAADIAYILGLRHGMEMKKILEKGGKITDLLDD